MVNLEFLQFWKMLYYSSESLQMYCLLLVLFFTVHELAEGQVSGYISPYLEEGWLT